MCPDNRSKLQARCACVSVPKTAAVELGALTIAHTSLLTLPHACHAAARRPSPFVAHNNFGGGFGAWPCHVPCVAGTATLQPLPRSCLAPSCSNSSPCRHHACALRPPVAPRPLSFPPCVSVSASSSCPHLPRLQTSPCPNPHPPPHTPPVSDQDRVALTAMRFGSPHSAGAAQFFAPPDIDEAANSGQGE